MTKVGTCFISMEWFISELAYLAHQVKDIDEDYERAIFYGLQDGVDWTIMV